MSASVQNLDTFLNHLQQLSGLQLCIKNFSSSTLSKSLFARIPRRFNLHTTRFCREVKQTHNEQCCQCDLRDVPAKAFATHQPFVHRCHARANELIIPVVNQHSVAAILYLGQFRLGADQPVELPLFTQEKVAQLLSLGWMVQRFFLYEVEFNSAPEGSADYRREQIIQIINGKIRHNIQLTDLAKELHLSASRTSHLVKELTGKSFVELKMELRVNLACRLLSTTLLTVESIATETGFEDVRYFYRVFDKLTGFTPGQWRGAHRSASADA